MYVSHTNESARTMRTTIALDERLVEEAQRLTGVQERTALIHEGLKALIQRESARRLALLGSSEPRLLNNRRRRSSDA
jgi:Arc/MetJ family transcription regulator